MNSVFKKPFFILIFLCLSFASFGFSQDTSKAAVSDLAAQLSAGGDVVLGAGRFELNEAVSITTDLNLSGASKDRTIIALTAAPIGIMIEGDISVSISGISFEYQGQETADILSITNASFEISDARFLGARYIESEDEDADVFGSGIYLLGSAVGTVRNSEFIANQLDGISIDETSSLTLEGNVFRANDSGVGVYLDAQLSASGNSFSENGASGFAAIYAIDNANLVLNDNSFIDNFSNAIQLGDNTKLEATKNRFEGNDSLQDSLAAIILHDKASATLTDNTILNNLGGALSLFEQTSATLTNNQITANQTWAAIYAADSSSLFLENNELTQSEGIGVYAKDMAELTLSSNTFSGNGDFAVHLEGQSRASISNNTFETNRSGVVLFEQSSAMLQNNTVSNNMYTGIAFFDESTGSVQDNTITNHPKNGILASDQSSPELTGNTLSTNQYGILLLSQTLATANGNTLVENEHGIYIVDNSVDSANYQDNIFENNNADISEGAKPSDE